MGMLQAILFDLDNTLLDRTRSFRSFTQGLINCYFPNFKGSHKEQVLERIVDLDEDGYRSKPELFQQLLKELPFEPGVTSEELLGYYKTQYPRGAFPMAGADRVLELCRDSGLAIGLVTNGQTAIQLGKLAALGWTASFDAVMISEAAGCKKPDPAIFRQALSQLGVEPGSAVFVGDHPANDVGGAASAGIQAVWLRRNQSWREGLPLPVLTIDHLEELQPWISSRC